MKETGPAWLACRVSCYRPFESLAFAHLAELGVPWVEMHAPEADKLAETQAALGTHGLRVSMAQARAFLQEAEFVSQVRGAAEMAKQLEARLVLLNIASNETPMATVVERLRRAGDEAERLGVTLAIETHPDLAHNAAATLATMREVDHPRVRINFDPANILYYNVGMDPVRELEQIAKYLVGVHLKDTPGGYQQREFPALGRGVVDFVGLFATLRRAGFDGPCTIELENTPGQTPTEAAVCARVAESVEFIRRLGIPG